MQGWVRPAAYGNCTDCANKAEKDIEVVEAPMCSRANMSERSQLVGNPIAPSSGEKVQTEQDWADSAAHSLSFSRSYRSNGFGERAGMGSHWSHSYSSSMTGNASGWTVRLGNGNAVLFNKDSSTGAWSSSEPDTLQEITGGWMYTRASDYSRWVFDSTGRLLSTTERNGWVRTFAYTGQRLASVTNAFGRSLQFAYDSLGRLAAVSTPDGTVVRYSFDDMWRLTGVQQPDGVSRAYLYENTAFPRALTGIIDESGQRFATFAYDSYGRAISTAHAGGVESFTIDYGLTPPRTVGQLVAGHGSDAPALNQATAQVTDALGNVQTYAFQGGGGSTASAGASSPGGGSNIASRTLGPGNLPTQEQDFLGALTTYIWNLDRQLVVSTTKAANKPEAQTVTTEWHSTFRLPVLVTEPGRTTAYTYDSNGNQLTETVTDTASSVARTREWSYNTAGLVATETAANGAVTSYGYDPQGNRTSVTNAMGHVTRYEYDGAGRVLRESTPNGWVTRYTYDARGRLLSLARGNELTRYTYTATGQLASVSLPSGHAIAYQYDAAQRLIGSTDNRGANTVYTLDNLGNRTLEQIKDAGNNVAWQMARTINSLNRIGSETVGANTSTVYGYDANGEKVAQTNALSQAAGYTLDGLKRVIAVTNAASATAGLAYNGLDAVVTATDFKGVATSYARDALGNATGESSADSGSRSTQFDALGLPSQTVDALGQTTSIVRDALGRPTQLNHADGKSTELGYDTSGDALREITDRSGITNWRRDAQGRVISKTQVLANGARLATAYAYTTTGLLEKIWYPGGGLLQHLYDSTGQLVGLNWNNAPLVTDITWTPLGQPKSWNWALTSPLAASRSYDTAGRVTATEFSSYSYDSAGRITSLTQQLYGPSDSNPANSGVTATTATWTVGYDSVGRIVSFGDGSNSASFSYDANGNRLTSVQSTGSGTATQTISRSYTVSSNQLTGFGQSTYNGSTTATTSIGYTHNANGDLTGDGLRSYGYDAEGRLSSSTVGQTDESPTTRYAHNALGQRVFKTEALYPGVQGDENDQGFLDSLIAFFRKLWSPGTVSAEELGWAYGYDEAGTLLAEIGSGGANSTGSRKYVWLPTATGPMPIAAIVDGTKYAVHADHLNTPRRLTRVDGSVAWQWSYSAFGEEKPTIAAQRFVNPEVTPNGGTTSVPAVEFNLRYPGQYADKESGLHYNYFRTYSAQTGRYTQPDPIGLDGGWNRYLYADAVPLGAIDHTGLVAWTGRYHARSIVEGVGAGWVNFELTSACVNGRRYKAKVVGIGSGGGVGVKGIVVGEAYGNVTLNDTYSEVRPEALSGQFVWASIGFGVGSFDRSVGRVVVGKARGWNPEHRSGLDIGATAIFGSATVLSGDWEDCSCDAK